MILTFYEKSLKFRKNKNKNNEKFKTLNFEFCLKLKTETEPQTRGFSGLTVWIFTKWFGLVQVSRF